MDSLDMSSLSHIRGTSRRSSSRSEMTNAMHQAHSIGIPAVIPITDRIRHPECNANEAAFLSMEGNHAEYQGMCNNGHHYRVRVLLEEKESQSAAKIENGEIKLGESEDFVAPSLEEY